MPPMTERVIAGRYNLQNPIGRGAMGVVWRARDGLLERDVAVKEVVISAMLGADERRNVYQRTLREARTAARLSHPGVVAVFDVAEEDGRPWIIMELVPSQSLDQILTVDGRLPPLRAARIGQQLLSALAHAHAAGVLHRDVKPSNVLIATDRTGSGWEERAVLTDFGIAQFEGDPRLTQTGMVMGSPGFTAPERIRGGDATPGSDLWSLGATLYAAVEGRGPYEQRGGAITTMSAIINEDAPAASHAGRLAPLIAALLRREPRERPSATAAAIMLSQIVPLLSGGADTERPASHPPTIHSPYVPPPGRPAASAPVSPAVSTAPSAPAGRAPGPDAAVDVPRPAPASERPPAVAPAPTTPDNPEPALSWTAADGASSVAAAASADEADGASASTGAAGTGIADARVGEASAADARVGEASAAEASAADAGAVDVRPEGEGDASGDDDGAEVDATDATDAGWNGRATDADEGERASADAAEADVDKAEGDEAEGEGLEAAAAGAGACDIAAAGVGVAAAVAAGVGPVDAVDGAEASSEPVTSMSPVIAPEAKPDPVPAPTTPKATPTFTAAKPGERPLPTFSAARSAAPPGSGYRPAQAGWSQAGWSQAGWSQSEQPLSGRPQSGQQSGWAPPDGKAQGWAGQARPGGTTPFPAGGASYAGPSRAHPDLAAQYPPGSGGGRTTRTGKRARGRRRAALVAGAILIAGAIGAGTAYAIGHVGTSHLSNASNNSVTLPATVPPTVAALDHPSSILPADWKTYTVTAAEAGTTAGFSIDLPPGWTEQRQPDKAVTYFYGPGDEYIDIDLRKHTYSNMLTEAKYIEENSFFPGYRRLQIDSEPVRGTAGAFWKFTFDSASGKLQANDILFIKPTPAGSQSYAILFETRNAMWNATVPLWEKILRTFQTVPASGS